MVIVLSVDVQYDGRLLPDIILLRLLLYATNIGGSNKNPMLSFVRTTEVPD